MEWQRGKMRGWEIQKGNHIQYTAGVFNPRPGKGISQNTMRYEQSRVFLVLIFFFTFGHKIS